MPFYKLSAKEKNIIRDYIYYYGANGGDRIRDLARIEDILNPWHEAKSEYLYKMLGEQLILEEPVTVNKGSDLLRIEFDSKRYCHGSAINTFLNEYDRFVRRTMGHQEYYSNANQIFSHGLRSSHCLVENKFCDGWETYLPAEITVNGTRIVADKNSRPIRILGKIAKAAGFFEQYEAFRIEHSQILNQKTLSGNMCFSIHPMDYMTMSDNANGWSSCMSWQETGGYRAGTVEMMNSTNTIVVYLKSETETMVRDNWNSKKWRLLVVVDPDGIISVKSYPYYSEGLTRKAMEYIKNLVETNLHWEMGPIEPFRAWDAMEYCGNTYKFNMTTFTMYNDFGCCDHFCCLPVTPCVSEQTLVKEIVYSGKRTCMCCGCEKKYGFYDEAALMCDCCFEYENDDDYCYCDHCGARIYADDTYWIHGDLPYCEHCAEKYAAYDGLVCEHIFNEEAIEVFLARKDDAPNTSDDSSMFIGEQFAENISMNRYSDFTIDHPRRTADGVYYLNRDDLLERAYYLYGYWRTEDFNNYFAD